MSISDVVSSDPALALAGTVIGGVWTLFKSLDWFGRSRTAQYRKAIEALEAGVDYTYRTYVEAIKTARADGQLTSDEKKEARRRAKAAAIQFGRTRGIDVLSQIGEECLDVWIAKLVKTLKG